MRSIPGKGKDISFLPTRPKELRPAQPPIQLVRELILEDNVTGTEIKSRLHGIPTLRMCGTLSPVTANVRVFLS